MIKRLIFIVFATLIFELANCQNYFSNPSFEEFYILPRNFTMVEEKNTEIIPRWWFLATPDYFHQYCEYKDVQVPKNFAGVNKPKQGKAYAGLILRADPEKYKLRNQPDSKYYSEHLQNVLDKPLDTNQLYCCKVYLSLSEYSGLAVDGFGIYFSEKLIVFENKADVLKYKPQIENKDGNIMFVQKGWMEFSGMYRATGREKYAVFGNFKSLEDTKYLRIKAKQKDKMNLFAYYYIDDIKMIPINDTSECECSAISHSVRKYPREIQEEVVEYANDFDEFNLDTLTQIQSDQFGIIELGKPVILKNIYFDFDKYELLPKSYTELNILYEILLKNCLRCNIIIEGHTDSYGSDLYNKELSENRAQAVADYLIKKGITGNRITFKGYGSNRPIDTNETDEGRQNNRRVEFIITK